MKVRNVTFCNFITDFEQIPHIVLVFQFLTLNKLTPSSLLGTLIV